MSPLPYRLVLDNSAISALHTAEGLSRVLEFWPGQWLVPLEVRGEAVAWKAEGARVTVILDQLVASQVIEFGAIEPRAEGPLFARLQRTLGQGESAAIAIAFHRKLGMVSTTIARGEPPAASCRRFPGWPRRGSSIMRCRTDY